ncbi:MAG: AAA family ATPase [Myxococcota bacterium]
MEKQFHLFIRKHTGGGCSVSVLGRPELTAFAATEEAARADLSVALMRFLGEDKLRLLHTRTHWQGMKLRRLDLTLRAMQQNRLLEVPMRFTLLTHPELPDEDDDEDPVDDVLTLRIPRLGVVTTLKQPEDLMPFAEEVIRHQLHLAPLRRLLDVAYDGEETVDVMSVPYTQRAEREEKRKTQRKKPARRTPPPPTLGAAAHRLNDDVERDRLQQAFQMDLVLGHLMQALTTRKASVMLVGPSGVGKTALVHELVRRAEAAAPGSDLKGLEVYTTSASRIIAGMRYLGQWQERATQMVQELRGRKAVLHVESLAELMSMRAGESGMDLAQFFAQAVETGDVAMVCEATPEDVARAERTHPAFVHAFRRIVVSPLTAAAAWTALQQAAQRLTRLHKVTFTSDALTRASELNERFGQVNVLGGAIQLLREAATHEGRKGGVVDAPDVITALSARTGYPRELMDPRAPLDPEAVLARFRARVVGQDAAMVLLRDLVVTLKTGLSDPSRPLGSFLLLGPTGVGKTESALALAEYLFGDEKRLARFDMAEYAAPGSAQRLVSTYGGVEGALARRVREQPFGVVLFDEVEKADPGVHDLLLQILGEGRLTDGTGNTVSFRNTVIMLTSNLGADLVGRRMGFSNPESSDLAAHHLSAAAAFFRPELLNRMDHVVPYHALGASVVQAIARKVMAQALEREGVTRRGVRVRYDDAVVERVASLGFDPRYGARPLKRAVETWVVAPVARLLAASGARPPAEIHVVVRGDGVGVAPASVLAVLSLDAEALRRSLRDHARAHSARLVVRAGNAAGVAHLEWLVQRYVDFVARHGGATTVRRGEDALQVELQVEGEVPALLVHECGVHVFTTTGEPRRVTVRTAEGTAPENVRSYEQDPPLVVDHVSGLEHVGSWEVALGPEWLERFILLRAKAA